MLAALVGDDCQEAGMEQEAEQIRAAVWGLRRPAANTPYPRQLRQRAAAYVRRRRGEGAAWADVAAEVGISVYTLRDGLEKDAGPGRVRTERKGADALAAPTSGEREPHEVRTEALLPVRVKTDEAAPPEAGPLELVTPKGYRLSGLSLTQALELLRRLS